MAKQLTTTKSPRIREIDNNLRLRRSTKHPVGVTFRTSSSSPSNTGKLLLPGTRLLPLLVHFLQQPGDLFSFPPMLQHLTLSVDGRRPSNTGKFLLQTIYTNTQNTSSRYKYQRGILAKEMTSPHRGGRRTMVGGLRTSCRGMGMET